MTVGNLQDQQCSDASSWRSAADLTTWFSMDAGAATTWQAFGVFRTNLTSAATVRWTVSNVADFSVLVYDSGTLSAGVVAGIGQAVFVAPSVITGRYAAVDIEDPTNPDGFISVGGAYFGPMWRPAINISPQSALAHTRARSVVTARSGTQYVTPLFMQRGWTIAHDGLAIADLWTQLWPLDQAAHLGQNILLIPDSASANRQAESVFGLFEVTSNITYQTPLGETRSWRGRILERL